MDEFISELKRDFEDYLSHIDHKVYNPCSKDFTSALNIGLMKFLLEHYKEEHHVIDSDVEEEIRGAKHYNDMYLSTGDPQYHEMALDEIKHANILLSKMTGSDKTEKVAELSNLTTTVLVKV